MAFNSLTFILFFALVLLLHSLPLPWRVKKLNLLLFSYIFYAAWDARFLLLLLFCTIVNWHLAKLLDLIQSPSTRRTLVRAGVIINLGLLGLFKYTGFVLGNLFHVLHLSWSAIPSIILPIGISFYTFQNLSYILDVYYRRTRPCASFLDYSVYVAFFPKLIAGPIVRASEFLPQLMNPRKASGSQLSWGLTLMSIGLFEKSVIADQLFAPITSSISELTSRPDFYSAWLWAFAVAGQIFYDFAGYSTCAIGVALCLGFELPINFNYPYAAVGFADFWRRWHITLSTWLRDYLFYSLGGARKRWRMYTNLLITMTLAGLWHGASWGFIAWGTLHGLYLVGERAFIKRPLKKHFLAGVVTFLFVCISWVFFSAKGLSQALVISRSMFLGGNQRFLQRSEMLLILAATIVMLILHWIMRNASLEQIAKRTPWWMSSVILTTILVILTFRLLAGDDRAFIYFKF